MPVLKHRDRVVVFRLTQEEYEKLLLECARRGSRNVTDFIRSEVLVSLLELEVPPGERGYLSAIDQKITRVQSNVQRLLQLMSEQSNHALPNKSQAEVS